MQFFATLLLHRFIVDCNPRLARIGLENVIWDYGIIFRTLIYSSQNVAMFMNMNDRAERKLIPSLFRIYRMHCFQSKTWQAQRKLLYLNLNFKLAARPIIETFYFKTPKIGLNVQDTVTVTSVNLR